MGLELARPPAQRAAGQAGWRGFPPALAGRLRAVNPFAIGVPVSLLAAWYLSDLTRPAGFTMFPTLGSVLSSWTDWVFDTTRGRYFYSGTFPADLLASVLRVLGGLVIGSALAVALGLSALWLPVIEKATDPIIQILRPIPKTAFLPFAILLCGLGNGPALFLTIYGVFLIVYVQVVTSIKLVPADLRDAAAMLGASESRVLVSIVLPAALPGILGGIRVGASYAWLILILAEMLAVQEGFGYVLWHAYEFLRMDVVVAAMLTIGACGYATDRLIMALMHRRLSWAEDIARTTL